MQADQLALANIAGKNTGAIVAVVGDSFSEGCSIFGQKFSQPINITGVVNNGAGLNCPVGNGTLAWDAGQRTLQWTAPGDTPGAAVQVADGIYWLPSGTIGNNIRVNVTARALPASNKIDTLTAAQVASLNDTRMWRRAKGGWMYIADALTAGQLRWLENFGIGGNRPADIAKRIQQVIAAKPDICIAQMGTNGIVSARSPVADVVADTCNVWDTLLDAGIPVIAILITPRFAANSADAANYTAQLQSNILEYNNYVTREAAARRGVYVVNVWPQCVDLNSATGVLRAGYSDDGLHPAGAMAFELGQQIAQILRNLIPINRTQTVVGASSAYHAVNNRQGNMLAGRQGDFAGITGIVQGGAVMGTGLGDGWTLGRKVGASVTATANKVPDPDGGPEWQEVVVSGAAVDNESFWLYPQAIATGGFAVGDMAQCEFEFKLTGSGCSGIYGDVIFTGGNVPAWEAQQLMSVINMRPCNGVIKWEPLPWRLGTTNAQPRIWFTSRAGGNFKLWVRGLVLNKRLPS